MKVSDKGIAEILSHEALVTSPYKDSVGVWTIGVGHTSAAGRPNPQTMPRGIARPVAELVALFRADLAKFEAGVNEAVKVRLAQHEFDALVSFHFNTGAIGRASFVKRLNAGDREGAAAGMLQWNKPPEIMGRRKAEMNLFRFGTYSNDGKCTVYPASASGAVQWSSGKRISVASLIAPAPVAPAPATITPSKPVESAPAAPGGFWKRFAAGVAAAIKGTRNG
jgi:lysozyme